MNRKHVVTGGGGVRLNVREWGNPRARPILFIHGWSESHWCWFKQYESDLADDHRLIGLDNRGHGLSEVPLSPHSYSDSKLWADDIHAVISELELDSPILVGWSYGGLIMTDYVREYGDSAIAGLNYVCAASCLRPTALGRYIGEGLTQHLPDAVSDDLGRMVDAIRQINANCFAIKLAPEDYERVMCWTMMVRPEVRGFLLDRDVDGDDVLAGMRKPVLVTQGRLDTLVLPAMAEHIGAVCPTAQLSWYAASGHAPFLEEPVRFNRELREFALGLAS